MKIIIAGGAGFLGKELKRFFLSKNSEVKILTRNSKNKNDIYWDGRTVGDWKTDLDNADVLINLAGKSVDCRYTEKNKKEILSSRIESTKVLQEAIDQCENPPKIWLNASSATIYIHSESNLHTEEDGIIGDDFSMNICKQWEAEFFKKENKNVRKVALRTSIVLGKNGGAFPKFVQISNLGLGGAQGKGNQLMSWIHIEDFCKAIAFIIDNENIKGSINVTAPNTLPNKEMMTLLRKKVKAPFGIPAPVWLLEIAAIFIKTETELMLKSRNVFPQKLIDAGFEFSNPNFNKALETLI
ncbi:TIGR01777 family protein [Kaistella sp. G5-32]|uniref:TIGR01777 family protein n=1 Tax=Kaistella gelatinilytica TaxID=2787636 RepID=A0ABS0F8S7_9FLAO|nr:TIGR01777 family oxidoreductase [Kaistella gelatinilytica]MBF8456111.1 TIGR01777 family protein [Kaistella gelatinilytica]